jgi:hypothetical protein
MLIEFDKNCMVLFMRTGSTMYTERARFVTILSATFPLLAAQKNQVKILCCEQIFNWPLNFLICAISSFEHKVIKNKNSTTNTNHKNILLIVALSDKTLSFPQLVILLVQA